MEVPPAINESRIASLMIRFAGNNAPGRVLFAGSLAMILSSAVGSVITYGMLPEQMRIHWTLGMGPYYGPEFAPTVLILVLFPVLILGTAVLAYSVDARLRDATEFDPIRPYYIAAMLGTLGVLLGSQVALVVANL